jgi:hypothetical protein
LARSGWVILWRSANAKRGCGWLTKLDQHGPVKENRIADGKGLTAERDR